MFGGFVTDRCAKCSKVEEHFGKQWCGVYRWPDTIWNRGTCPFIHQEIKLEVKVRVGQQKQYKLMR